ncbi:Z1 domain-containing protein [Lysinibacillus capsici]|uniref:Z1 domain-containing protein n=1 Tax=Lysinibacillus capsici TaxID=2115968 RepID=UPI002E20EB6A|nr:Z1 domain-containing protein [Lysinibacillus capsici]
MEQRARWFGYKSKYLDVCRIYLTKSLQKGFANLLGHEDDLWSVLEELEKNGEKIENWKERIFRLEATFNPTRKSVGTAAKLKHGWIYLDFAEESIEPALNNSKLVKTLFEDNGELTKYGELTHLVYRNCESSVINNFLTNLSYKNEENIKKVSLIKNIINLLSTNNAYTEIDTVLIDPTKARTRTISTKGKFSKIPQGYTPRRMENDPKYYCGDMNILKGKFQIQFHIITPKERELHETVVLGLYVPEDVQDKVGRILKASV